MHKPLIRSKTRIFLRQVTSTLVCSVMAMPPAALGEAPVGTGQLPGQKTINSDNVGLNKRFDIEQQNKHQEALRANQKQINDLTRQVERMRAQAKEEAAEAYQQATDEISKLTPTYRGQLGNIETRTPAPAAKGRGASHFHFVRGRIYALLFWTEIVHAEGGRETSQPTFEPANQPISSLLEHAKDRTNFLNELGRLGAGFEPQGADLPPKPRFTSFNDTDPKNSKTDFLTAIKEVAQKYGADPDATANAVMSHYRAEEKLTVNFLHNQRTNTTKRDPTAFSGHEPLATPKEADAILNGDKAEGIKLGIQENTIKDLAETVKKVTSILSAAKGSIKQAQAKLDAAASLEEQAKELANNPPQPPQNSGGAGNEQQPQPKPPGSGNGGGGKGGGGGGGRGVDIAQPGPLPDSTNLYAKPPETPDVSAIANASQFEPRALPKFEAPEGGLKIPPGILPANGKTPVAAAGNPLQPQAGNIIPGNSSPGSAIDKSMFASPQAAAGGEGGGGQPTTIGGGAGGSGGSALGGEDIGRGLGASYGSRGRLTDAVKKYEAGAGGGSTAEAGGGPAGGSENALSPNLMGQIATGKKIKDGTGKGAMGLMGQISTLLQTQCGDQTQRAKFEDFCLNAISIGAKETTKKDDRVASSTAAPQRDLASERGASAAK